MVLRLRSRHLRQRQRAGLDRDQQLRRFETPARRKRVAEIHQIVVGRLPLAARDLLPEIGRRVREVRAVLVGDADDRGLRALRQALKLDAAGGRVVVGSDGVVVGVERFRVDRVALRCRDGQRIGARRSFAPRPRAGPDMASATRPMSDLAPAPEGSRRCARRDRSRPRSSRRYGHRDCRRHRAAHSRSASRLRAPR